MTIPVNVISSFGLRQLLQRLLYALAALFSLEMYGYRKIAQKNSEEMFVPTIKAIFSIKNSHWKDVNMGNGVVVIGENLYMS